MIVNYGTYPGGPLGQILLMASQAFIGILTGAIIVQSLLTWFVPQGVPRLSALLYELTQPLLGPIRRTIPPFGMMDLSPLIAILLLQFLIGPLLGWLIALIAGG